MKNHFSWLKTAGYLFIFLLVGGLVPADPIDPWGLFSPKKIVYLIFALAFIQALGAFLIRWLGARAGAILLGFFGGFISSTAMTVFLARKSKKTPTKNANTESLAFLGATLGMLIEALVIVFIGSETFDPQLLILFGGPLAVTITMIVLRSRDSHETPLDFAGSIELKLMSLVRLAAFIAGILAFSKILQNLFGQSGILVLTFLVSLFEVHGSFIANVQLHEAGVVSIRLLGGLTALAIAASYVSKLFLVMTLGSPFFKSRVLNWTGYILLSLIASWSVFQFLI